MTSTVKKNEIAQFQKDSRDWWTPGGPFSILHVLNPVRLEFITDLLSPSSSTTAQKKKSNEGRLSGQTILDIGCGGGLICEPLTRLGATVTGIDADSQAIEVAKAHAQGSALEITYKNMAIEDLTAGRDGKHKMFDTVLALEILEHVTDPKLFLSELTRCVKPGGIVILSTLNRTWKSWALGVIAAEYILGWVPKGTHSWDQFIRPSTLARLMAAQGFTPIRANGISYNPVTGAFHLAPNDLSINYIMAFRKEI